MAADIQWVHREQDFAEPFSSALHVSQGAQFRLMLACLSPHAPDWQDPPEPEQPSRWVPPFALGVQQPLYASEQDLKRPLKGLSEQSFSDWFLTDCLQPEPLVPNTEQITLPELVQQSLPHWLVAREQSRGESTLREADLVDMLDQLQTAE